MLTDKEREYHKLYARKRRVTHKSKICEQRRIKRLENKEHVNELRKQWRRRVPELSMFTNAKTRARLNNWEFDITEDDIKIPEFCPVFGIKLEVGNEQHEGSPSIDRIDSKKGYVKGNVIVVSWKANNIKGAATPEELQKVADFYRGL